MLNNKSLYGQDLPEYEKELRSTKNNSELSDVIVKNRQAIFELFKLDTAEGQGETYEKLKKGDQTLLEKISKLLKSKKTIYQDALGSNKEFDAATDKVSLFDLRKDEIIFGLWKDLSPRIDTEKTYNKNEKTKEKIHSVIKEFNKLQWKINKGASSIGEGEYGSKPTLLDSSDSGDDEEGVLGKNTLEDIFGKKYSVETEKTLKGIITNGGDGLSIGKGIYGLKNKEDRTISRRIVVGLWLLYYAAEHTDTAFSDTQLQNIDHYLDQVTKKEIPCIRSINSVDFQTHYTDDLHDKLDDLNKKEPARETHDIGLNQQDATFTSDLSNLFENGKATNIENYALVGEQITILDKNNHPFPGKVFLRDVAGEDNTIAETKDTDVSRKIVRKFGGQEIVIGEVFMDNKTLGKASLVANFNNLQSLSDNITTNAVTDKLPLSISLPVKAIKQAKIKGHNAARTKHIDIVLVGSPVPVPIPVPVPVPVGPKPIIDAKIDVNATLSNTFKVREAIAERKAGDEMREKWKATGWINAPQKLNLFLRRKSIKDGLTNKYLNYTDYDKTGQLNWDTDSVSAAGRHGLEASQGFNDRVENVLGQMVGIENDYPNTYKEIVKLSEEYIGNAVNSRNPPMTEAEFQTKFQTILQRSNALDPSRPATATMADGKWKPLNELLGQNDMSQLSTDIIGQITAFRAHRVLVNTIYRTIDAGRKTYPQWETDSTESAAMNAALNTSIKPLISTYVSTYHIMPSFLKSLKLNLDDPDVMLQLSTLSRHHMALTQIQKQTLNLKLQVFNKGEEAYDVQENLNRLAKTGRWLDDPLKNSTYFKKRPGLKKFMGYVWGTTKLGALAVPGIVATSMGAPLLAYAGIYGGSALVQTLFKKYSHYNKEHRLYQRKQATMVNTTRQERDAVFNAVQNMGRWEGRFWGEKLKTRRKLKYYINTTQDQLDLSKDLAAHMSTELETLNTSNNTNLQDYASDALARLDFHKKTGQNFLGSDKPTEAEAEYKILQQLVVTAADRLGMTLDQLRQYGNYQTVTNIIEGGTGNGDTYKNQGYTKARKRFKTRERQQAAIGATKAGAVAFGMAYAMGALTGKGASNETVTTGNNTSTANFELGKHSEVNYSSGSNLERDMTTFLNNPTSVQSGGQLNVYLTGSTDLTGIAHPSAFNAVSYEAWKDEVLHHITTLQTSGTLHPNYATQLTDWVNANQATLPSSFGGHVNENLAAKRLLTGVWEMSDSLANSTNTAVSGGSLALNISSGGSALPTAVHNQAERFVSASIEAIKENQIPGSNGYGFGIGWDNTFDMNREPNNREGQQQ